MEIKDGYMCDEFGKTIHKMTPYDKIYYWSWYEKLNEAERDKMCKKCAKRKAKEEKERKEREEQEKAEREAKKAKTNKDDQSNPKPS